MKKTILILSTLMISAAMLGACSKSTPETEPAGSITDSNNTEQTNPFESGQAAANLGSMGHGFANPQVDANGKMLPFRYEGQEMKIDYAAHASGKGKNIGFLLYVDGVAQPYKFNETDAPYEYMHIVELAEDDKDTPFSFLFTPVTGKKGETANINIIAMYNPAFMPDMKETSSYGFYHDTLEATGSLAFDQDTSGLDVSTIPQFKQLSDVRLSSEPVTKELMERHSGLETVDLDKLDTSVYSEVLIDGEAKQDNYRLKDGKLQLTLKMFGHPGVRFKHIFYLNHKPLTDENGQIIETELNKGEVAVIDAVLDTKKLDDLNTFYTISIPMNAADFPDDVVVAVKTASLLLYK
ncbi:beta-glucanase/beta-glucan synthetase [Paenibacillus sp. GCM10027626]|uniref:beta-glucanase/beta-glucan synthetase n=1 Tax=Paenibacillus sp. GCM10027626 TaxID=3273411 RepID=UPI003635BE74